MWKLDVKNKNIKFQGTRIDNPVKNTFVFYVQLKHKDRYGDVDGFLEKIKITTQSNEEAVLLWILLNAEFNSIDKEGFDLDSIIDAFMEYAESDNREMSKEACLNLVYEVILKERCDEYLDAIIIKLINTWAVELGLFVNNKEDSEDYAHMYLFDLVYYNKYGIKYNISMVDIDINSFI